MRPACGRCVRADRTCPGYARDDVNFRSMNKSAETKVRTRIRGKLESRKRDDWGPSGPPDAFQPTRVITDMEIARSVPTDWTQQSTELLFMEWVEPPDALKSSWGSWEDLPDLYGRVDAPHLNEAVRAMAFANRRNVSSIGHFDVMARNAYGKALVNLSTVMNGPRAATRETLAAVGALSTYEVTLLNL